MTSLSAYTLLQTPCCGARYKDLAYASINLRGRQSWSDGFYVAPLFRPSFPVCKCQVCGTLFLSRDGVEIGYIDNDDDRWKALEDEFPSAPSMTPNQMVSAVLPDMEVELPSAEIELLLRLAFWRQLNHHFRAPFPKSGDPIPSWRETAAGVRQGVRPKGDAEAVAAAIQEQISTQLPWHELSDAAVDAMVEGNLTRLLPLLEELESDNPLLLGEAYRALGQMGPAIGHFQRVTGSDALEAAHLVELARAGERRVIRIEPPDWVEPPLKPEPWVNPSLHGRIVPLQSRVYWYKIFGMLQQGWALVEPDPDGRGVMLYKVRDDSEIYGQQWFADVASAETFLLFNGYQRFDESPDVWSILVPPGGPFQLEQDVPAKISPGRQVKALIREGLMPLRWQPRLEEEPDMPNPADLEDKVAGMLLGLAIGDALGNTSESLLPEERMRRHGWITDYLPNRHADGQRVGLPSDDTQLAFWSLEHLVEAGELNPPMLAEKFSERRIFGLGQSVRQFLRDFKLGKDWSRAGAPSAGNGALMRIAPILLPHLFDPSPSLWTDTLLAAHVTHRDALSNVACLAFVDLLWRWIGEEGVPERSIWLERFAAFCEDVEPEVGYEPRAGRPAGFKGALSKMIRQHVIPAIEGDLFVAEACSTWHSGAYLLETVPTVLFILARHADDPEAAILSAVNETKDNDTIAAIVGAAVGALHGRSKLPQRWIDGLSGRTGANDNGRVFELIDRAAERFGYGGD